MVKQFLPKALHHFKNNLLTVVMVFLAGMSNGVMDTLQFHYGKSIFNNSVKFEQEFWNPDISWKNKYQDFPKDKSPRFPGSITIFVWLTDGWHFFQAAMLIFFLLSIILYKNQRSYIIRFLMLIILFSSFSLGFSLMYDFFLI
ncbi:hypothetical protein [Flexithrix dorotheae]|uniref:hypothetical protein n=1 Tax=Flexithrix dorotheae TaxID=70993 RepID=UPI000365B2A8|nr:hypothetical protein [Flexithrix dorotheae]